MQHPAASFDVIFSSHFSREGGGARFEETNGLANGPPNGNGQKDVLQRSRGGGQKGAGTGEVTKAAE